MKFKGVILDLDETIIDTRCLKKYRDRRDWTSCYKNFQMTSLYTDVENFFDLCRNMGLKVGIVTMAPRSYAEKILKYHNIPYDSLVAYHDVIHKKPHPEPMLKCAEDLALSPFEILSIGDDVRDIVAGKAAGMHTVGVDWGVSNQQKLKLAGASSITASFQELIKLL
jgi:HAD superfamily hydrolase (TIGR01662 family)